jgi:UDP-N-acetylglucosamine 1-carboxyvinyltransferase
MAGGTTRITGVEHIERGYEDIVRDFRTLGADISMLTGDGLKEHETSILGM